VIQLLRLAAVLQCIENAFLIVVGDSSFDKFSLSSELDEYLKKTIDHTVTSVLISKECLLRAHKILDNSNKQKLLISGYNLKNLNAPFFDCLEDIYNPEQSTELASSKQDCTLFNKILLSKGSRVVLNQLNKANSRFKKDSIMQAFDKLSKLRLGTVSVTASKKNGKSNTYFDKVEKEELKESPNLVVELEKLGISVDDYLGSLLQGRVLIIKMSFIIGLVLDNEGPTSNSAAKNKSNN